MRRTRELGDGMTAAEMIFILNALSVLAARRKDLERELVRLKNLRDQQQRVFQQARRERETLRACAMSNSAYTFAIKAGASKGSSMIPFFYGNPICGAARCNAALGRLRAVPTLLPVHHNTSADFPFP